MVTRAELQSAQDALRVAQAAPPPNAADPVAAERQLADKLVEQGKLTPYQATQLLAGRSKINLGSYRILDIVGEGGMGQVYKAEHNVMGRTVAVKVLPRSKSTPVAIASFTREIRAQAKLDHEHLVRAFDAGHDGNVYFLVTEFVPGMDLRRYVRSKGPLDMKEAATIISQAAEGLEHAHQLGLVHRDVKPGNILVTTDGHAKVSDLGLAGWLNEGEEALHKGKVVGTADYLPPEQILAPGAAAPVGDIYSLGCTLYYAVTGKVPYPGGTVREKCHRHCSADTPKIPRYFNAALSDDFMDVIADMMKKDPEVRIQTAEEVRRRLAPWAGDTVDAPDDCPQSDGAAPQTDEFLMQADELEDTAESFAEFADISLVEADNRSQTSQGTEPVASADQETLPNLRPARLSALGTKLSRVKPKIPTFSPLVVILAILIPAGLLAVIAMLVSILMSLGK